MDQKDNNKAYLSKQTDLAQWRKDIYDKTVEELSNSDKYKDFFSRYGEEWKKKFIERYAQQKVMWVEHGSEFAKYQRTRDERWTAKAIEALGLIQHKKLLNLLYQWASGEASIEGVAVAAELTAWHNKILDCPLIEPISPHEVDTYIQFLRAQPTEWQLDEDPFVILGEYCLYWYKNGDEPDDEDEHPWSLFFDNIYGTGHLRMKKPLRYIKEQRYREITREEENKKKAPQPHVASKPFLHLSDHKNILVERFESREFREQFYAHERFRERHQFRERTHSDIIELSEANRPVPVEYHDDWRQSLAIAREMYQRERVIDELAYVYDEYCDRITHKQSSKGWDPDYKEMNHIIITQIKESVLRGRKLCGEPEDFNY